MLAPVYIFYGFESAGDISEETKDAGRQVPRAMRLALIWGGIASLILTGALLLAMPKTRRGRARRSRAAASPFILGQLSTGVQDFLLLLIIFAFFSCGSSIQGAGSRLAFSYARDGALPGSNWLSAREQPLQDAGQRAAGRRGRSRSLFVLLVYLHAEQATIHIWLRHVPGEHQRARRARLVRRQRHLPLVLPHGHRRDDRAARAAGCPKASFRLGKLGLAGDDRSPSSTSALMLINVVYPTGLSQRSRRTSTYDWITLAVMVVIALVGAIYFVIARPDRKIATHRPRQRRRPKPRR